MKKTKKSLGIIIGVLAILGMSSNLWAYSRLKSLLVKGTQELPPIVDALTIGILISFVFICLFHLVLLFHTFYIIPRVSKRRFFTALFFCALILSGLFIASDSALLHDLGEEYEFWDVSQEWTMLFITSSLQLIVMVFGFILLISSKETSPFAFFPKSEKFDEGMFITVINVGLICGLIGLIMLPLPGIMGVGSQYKSGYLITLSALALTPFVSSIVYWLMRNRGKQRQEILDEKQFQDITIGSLFGVILLIILLFASIILRQLELIDLNNPMYAFIAIDLVILVISSTVLTRAQN